MPDGGPLAHCNLHFQPKQWAAASTVATELLYGGAAFGGKSHLMRCAAILWCCEIKGLQVYIFRRTEDDLIKNHMDGPHGFRNMLAGMEAAGFVKILATEIRWWNGSKIHLCHCHEEKHRFKYHGSEIHVLMLDELTTFTEVIYRYLRFRVRMVGVKLPEKYREGFVGPHGAVNTHNLFPRIVCGSNPGNIGHHWVKRTFIERPRPTTPQRMDDLEAGMVRQYIPARLGDNQIGLAEDPTYVARMRGLGDPMLVRAMELGDWNIIAGGFFPEFTLERHVLKAVTLPADVFSRRFRAHDHGSAKPFSTGWYAVCDDDWHAEGTLGNRILVPRGALVRYREWYGKKEGQDNVGLKLAVESWAAGALARDGLGEVRPAQTIADPSMWISDGGPSLAERADAILKGGHRLTMHKATNKREPGWDQVRHRLQGEDPENNGDPLLFLMDNQPDAIRLFQSVQHDETKPEDIDTDAEDHAIDEVRYGCMSRPRPIRKAAARKPPPGPKPWTIDWIIKQTSRQDKPSGYRME